ncbi:antitoxin [Candidatus Palauibacter sp.]|uniref:antitoxin n=1 Tax=Candidatus Palauibacter sp. TaxID=3101350 RepID=UPI003C6F4288
MASYRLQVLISGSLENRLRKAARRARVSRGAWVRRAIEDRLERESRGLPGDPLAALRALDAPTADIDVMIAEIEAGRS